MAEDLTPADLATLDQRPTATGNEVVDDVYAAYHEAAGRAPTDEPATAPAEKPQPAAGDRGADARFAKKPPPEKSEEKPADVAKPGEAEPDAKPAKEKPPEAPAGPPPGWSVQSKAAWAGLPEHIRADITKREGEMNQGLAALKDYKDLKPFAEMATNSGTTLAAALGRFTNLEQLCRRDIAKGVCAVTQNVGLNQQQAAELFLNLARQLGARVAPDQNGAPAAPPVSDQNDDPFVRALRPVLEPMVAEQRLLKQQLGDFTRAHQQAAERTLGSAIEAFAADPQHVFFNDLEETISSLFERKMVPLTGDHRVDLENAYAMACKLNPDVYEALIKQRVEAATKQATDANVVSRARQASRSLSSSPLPAGDRTQVPDRANDVLEDVRRAYAQHSGY